MDRIASAELAAALATIEGRSWAEYKGGKPITANSLARRLARYGIAPGGIRIGDRTPKGYLLGQFSEAFERYLPPEGNQSATSQQ